MSVFFSEVQKDMLKLLSASLWNEDMNDLDITNFTEINAELKNQTVQVLVSDLIEKTDISSSEETEYVKLVGQNYLLFHTLMQDQQELTDLFEETGIPVAVLKGAAAAVYYPVPEYRQMGDIDIIVEPENFEKAYNLMCEHGYHAEQELSEVSRHAGFETPSGIEVELHRCFSTNINKKKKQILDQCIYKGISQAEKHIVADYTVPILPVSENGLVLLAHINQHLSSGLGLRQIIDWMMYVHHNLDDDMWENTFSETADATGMKTLAETVTYLCKKYLGLSDRITWCDNADDELADELMLYILDKGNFGRKNEYGSRTTVSVLHRFYNPISAFAYLTAGGMLHWKAAKKYKILKYFAWIYQIGHLIRMGLKRKTGMKALSEELAQSGKEAKLLQRLGVTGR